MDKMRECSNVRMLNFACIKINSNSKALGMGSFSKVYRGTYRKREVAIKLILTMDLTVDVIQRISAEASILSSIRHKNVVNIEGVSVLPPSVCIILELCAFGSLSDVIRGNIFDGPTVLNARLALSICYLDRVYLSLGCARGLAAVHGFRSDLCHRDVKSFNFLCDSQFNAKIADLELGTGDKVVDEREDKRSNSSQYNNKSLLGIAGKIRGKVGEWTSFFSEPGVVSNEDDDEEQRLAQISDHGIMNGGGGGGGRAGTHVLSVEDMQATWLAPDVLRDRRYVQASDVVSFGVIVAYLFIL